MNNPDKLTNAFELEERSTFEYWQNRVMKFGLSDDNLAPWTSAAPKQRAMEYQFKVIAGALLTNHSRRILEIGCGQGRVGWVPALGQEYTGVDFTPQMIEAAQKRFPQYRYEVADARKLPFTDKSFDVVIGVDVASSLAWKWEEEVMPEVSRVLVDDGLFILAEEQYVRFWWKS